VPILRQNPVTLQILGICSALAVTTTLAAAATMAAALTVVIVCAAGIISLLRNHLPSSIRLIMQIIIVASLVIVVDQLLQAYFYEMSQRRARQSPALPLRAGPGLLELGRPPRSRPLLSAPVDLHRRGLGC